jgi:hypothetical protein
VRPALYTAALVVAVSFPSNAQFSDPYAGSKCKQIDSITRECHGSAGQFIEVTQPDWQLVTGQIGGETVTCITWGLSSAKELQKDVPPSVEQICVFGVLGLPETLPDVQRSFL